MFTGQTGIATTPAASVYLTNNWKKSPKMKISPQFSQKLASQLLRDGECAWMRASTDYPKMTEKQPATRAMGGRFAA